VFTTSFESDNATPAEVLAEAASAAGLDAQAVDGVDAALDLALAERGPPHVVICGSLHFIGDVLARSPETWPT
jgi:dihydrofolate synthase/folylpolyglutamate synthase